MENKKKLYSKWTILFYVFLIIFWISYKFGSSDISACKCADNFLFGSKNISFGANCIEKYAPNEFNIYGSPTTISNLAITDGNLQMDLFSHFSKICDNRKN